MHGLKDNYSLHVVVATVFASAMILISNNGVADAVKVTDEASMKGQQNQPLAPPGPFGQNSNWDNKASSGNQNQAVALTNRQSAPATPAPPNMPNLKQVAPTFGVAAPVALKPANKGVQQNVKINEPVFQRKMPTIPLAMQIRNPPVMNGRPSVPVVPTNNMIPPTVTMPVPGKMPRFNRNMLPQHAVPQFRGTPSQPGQLRAAPKIQQFKYIPLPVYQANYGLPQPPSFKANVPGYWVPQMNK